MHNIEPTDSPAEDDEEVDHIPSIAENVCSVGPSDKRHFAKEISSEMVIDDKSVIFQMDCGSLINIIPKSIVDKHKLTPTSKTLIMWNKTEVTPLGTARIIVTNPANRNKYSVEFVVVNEELLPLMRARAAQHTKLITVNWDNFKPAAPPKRSKPKVNNLLTLDQVVTQHSDVSERQLGCFSGVVHTEVDESVRPEVTPTHRIPTALKEKFKTELTRLEELGVIFTVEKPTPWVSSVVTATKKSGNLMICIDPRTLNKALKRERYQLPVLDEILPEVSKAKISSWSVFCR